MKIMKKCGLPTFFGYFWLPLPMVTRNTRRVKIRWLHLKKELSHLISSALLLVHCWTWASLTLGTFYVKTGRFWPTVTCWPDRLVQGSIPSFPSLCMDVICYDIPLVESYDTWVSFGWWHCVLTPSPLGQKGALEISKGFTAVIGSAALSLAERKTR